MGFKLWPVLPVFLVFAESQLDIIQEVVIGRAFAKGIGRTVLCHESVELVALQVRHLEHHGTVEAVVDKRLLLVINQPVLEGQRASFLLELEHLDQLVEVQPCPQTDASAPASCFRDMDTRFFIIEILLVLLPVLQGIIMIVTGHYTYFL
jgi:hypothetical protein